MLLPQSALVVCDLFDSNFDADNVVSGVGSLDLGTGLEFPPLYLRFASLQHRLLLICLLVFAEKLLCVAVAHESLLSVVRPCLCRSGSVMDLGADLLCVALFVG